MKQKSSFFWYSLAASVIHRVFDIMIFDVSIASRYVFILFIIFFSSA